MKTIVTGGTGLVGSALLPHLTDPIVLSRDPSRMRGVAGIGRTCGWDPGAEPAPLDALEGADVVFHLAGESVAEGRWTAEKKRRIRDSRIVGTRNLIAGLRTMDRKPVVLISDLVGYTEPLGPLGTVAHHLFVRRTLDRIFDYRRDAIGRLLAPLPTRQSADTETRHDHLT